MKFESKAKSCICSRNTDHEHSTLENYVIVEEYRNRDGENVQKSEIYMHGYDSEDDHLHDFMEECRESARSELKSNEYLSYNISLHLLRQIPV